jgi:hypothetical protein
LRAAAERVIVGKTGMHPRRKIVVDEEAYEWVLRDNSLAANGERHVAVYSPSKKGQTLHLDPYAWEFEVRPRTISEAIRFALGIGWTPTSPAPPMYLGFRDDQFFRLPDGMRFAHQSRDE